MSTGNFENWAGTIADIGPIYPFVGSEYILWIIGMAAWILWHFMQSRVEKKHYEEEMRKYGSKEKLRDIVSQEDPSNP